MESDLTLPTYIGLCPVHGQEFYMRLDDEPSLNCPQAGCDRTLVAYQRLPSPSKPSPEAMEIARQRFGYSDASYDDSDAR